MSGSSKLQQNITKIIESVQKWRQSFITECKTAREKLKDIPQTNYELGLMHLKNGNFTDATMRFKMVTYLRPDHAEAYYNLGKCLIIRGDNDNAKKNLNRAMQLKKNLAETDYFLQKIDNPEKITSIPDSIAEEKLSNTKSNNKHNKLIVDKVAEIIRPQAGSLNILELECASGDLGKMFKEKKLADKITATSFNIPENKSNYEQIEKTLPAKFLALNKEKFDLLIASNVITYEGKLGEFVKNVKSSLTDSGAVVFICSTIAEGDYKFDVKRDSFSYSEDYINKIFKQTGFRNLLTDKVTDDKDNVTLFLFNLQNEKKESEEESKKTKKSSVKKKANKEKQ